jgi:ParB/RepB/Spo0J family partition protein
MIMPTQTQKIGLGGIAVMPHRHRKLDDALVDKLMASIKAAGLFTPIIVRPRDDGEDGVVLIAGRHRYAAFKKLSEKNPDDYDAIPCIVLEGLTALEAEEIELRENVDRGELTTAEAAMHMARLIEIRKERNKLKTTPGPRKNGKTSPQFEGKSEGDKSANTAKVVAKETGRSASSVERSAIRAKKVPRLAELVGTSLDKGVEIDALAKLSLSEQDALIDKVIAGEQVSARVKKPLVANVEELNTVRRHTTAQDAMEDNATFVGTAKLSKHKSSAGVAEKAAALREQYAPATENDDPLRRQTPEARLTRMFDEAAVKLSNAVYTLAEAVDYMHAHKLDAARIPVRFCDELAHWEKVVAQMRKGKAA